MKLRDSEFVFHFAESSIAVNITMFGYDDFSERNGYKLWRKGNDNALHIVLGGKGWLMIGEEKYCIEENHAFCIAKNTLCRYYPDEENPWLYVWFNFVGDGDENLMQRIGFSDANPVKPINLYRLQDEIAEVIKALAAGEAGDVAVTALFYRIVGMMATGGADVIKTGNLLVYQMKKHIETHYVDPNFNISLLCKMLYLSDSYASRIFKNSEGITLKNYLMARRLSEAKNLLSNEACTIKDVALRCGYSDYVHFLKEFKRFTGVTAKEYRRTAIEQNKAGLTK